MSFWLQVISALVLFPSLEIIGYLTKSLESKVCSKQNDIDEYRGDRVVKTKNMLVE